MHHVSKLRIIRYRAMYLYWSIACDYNAYKIGRFIFCSFWERKVIYMIPKNGFLVKE